MLKPAPIMPTSTGSLRLVRSIFQSSIALGFSLVKAVVGDLLFTGSRKKAVLISAHKQIFYSHFGSKFKY